MNTKWFINLLLLLLSVTISTSSYAGGRCTGSPYCSACTNCSRCKHCSNGGSCGVCSGGSSIRSTRKSRSHITSSGTSGYRREESSNHTVSHSEQTISLYEEPPKPAKKKKQKKDEPVADEAVLPCKTPADSPKAEQALVVPVSDPPDSGGGGFILFMFLMNLTGIIIFIVAATKKNKKRPVQWRYR